MALKETAYSIVGLRDSAFNRRVRSRPRSVGPRPPEDRERRPGVQAGPLQV